jgi:hypothetical protein
MVVAPPFRAVVLLGVARRAAAGCCTLKRPMKSSTTFANADEFNDYGTVLTAETLNRLAAAMGVQWPEWYQTLMEVLLRRLPENGDWLPGGFLYSRPMLITRNTRAYRDGKAHVWVVEPGSRERKAVAWPHGHVVVGSCGEGAVVIDTASAAEKFYVIDRETQVLRVLIDVGAEAVSIEAFAQLLK